MVLCWTKMDAVACSVVHEFHRRVLWRLNRIWGHGWEFWDALACMLQGQQSSMLVSLVQFEGLVAENI